MTRKVGQRKLICLWTRKVHVPYCEVLYHLATDTSGPFLEANELFYSLLETYGAGNVCVKITPHRNYLKLSVCKFYGTIRRQ
jgi:hypothetical protein